MLLRHLLWKRIWRNRGREGEREGRKEQERKRSKPVFTKHSTIAFTYMLILNPHKHAGRWVFGAGNQSFLFCSWCSFDYISKSRSWIWWKIRTLSHTGLSHSHEDSATIEFPEHFPWEILSWPYTFKTSQPETQITWYSNHKARNSNHSKYWQTREPAVELRQSTLS